MELDTLVQKLEGLVAKADAAPAIDEAKVAEMVEAKVAALRDEVKQLVEAAMAPVAKALTDVSREGVGRKGVVGGEPQKTFEDAPVDFVVAKAAAVAKGDEDYSPVEKAVVVEMFKQFFNEGLIGGAE